jgi:uncharacterized protein with von Willebrand factor type A (vWA) domain
MIFLSGSDVLFSALLSLFFAVIYWPIDSFASAFALMSSLDQMNMNTLQTHIVHLARLLRGRGVSAGVQEECAALEAMGHVAIGDMQTVKAALRCVFAKSYAEMEIFDATFDAYFRADYQERRRMAAAAEHDITDEQDNSPPNEPPTKPAKTGVQTLLDWLHHGEAEPEGEEHLPSYSPTEVLARKDFAQMDAEEMQAASRLIASLTRLLTLNTSRRTEATRKREMPDLRRTVRSSLRGGGEVLRLLHKRRKVEKLRLVLLCDVSKSMDVYGVFVLQWLFGLHTAPSLTSRRHVQHIEAFCFATSLHHITPILKNRADTLSIRDIKATLAELTAATPDWSGGTRIGACLHDFLECHAPRVLTRRTVVVVVSDGWDTGEVELLANSMRELRRQAGAVLWLNPLAGSAVYEPATQGMAAALPHVDVFAAAHNVESLRGLVQHLRTARRLMRGKH